VLIYLGLSTLAVFVSALALSLLGASSPLAVTHLVLVGAVVPLIFGAITHFVPVLTRGRGAHRAVLLLPVLLQLSGLLVFLHFSGQLGLHALYLAAAIACLVAIVFTGWLIRRARHTLGQPHPCWRWYLAAVAVLIVGLLLVPAMYGWPLARQSLRLFHLHLNTLGFVGLTAIGTLQVLLPTALGAPDAEAATRLQKHLWPILVGVLMVSLGAAFWRPLSIAGATVLLYPPAILGYAWMYRYGWSALISHGASVSLLGALGGFLLLLASGLLHAFGWLDGRSAIPAFVAAFLLPLITGALTQLLPIWWHPGRRTGQRDRMHAMMGRAERLRVVCFLLGGLALAGGYNEGAGQVSVGLLIFVCVTARALMLPKTEIQ